MITEDKVVIAPSADPADQFEFTGVVGTGWPVGLMRPTKQDTIFTFDTSPNGSPSPHGNGLVNWVDLCEKDKKSNPTQNRAVRAGVGPAGVHLGSWKQAAAATCPVDLIVDGAPVAGLTTRGFKTSLMMNLGGGTFPTKIVTGGAITADRSFFKVDTSGGAANLDKIDGGVAGDVVIFRQVDNARDVTIKHNAAGGNIKNASGADLNLSNKDQMVMYFLGDDGTWRGGKLVS